MGKIDDSEFDVSRAELFEALGHSTRIKILLVLGESPMGFSDLKKSTGIESSGLLAFHLGKLEHLVAVNNDGRYALTDQGKEAKRMIGITKGEAGGQTVKVGVGRKKAYLATLVVLLLALATVSAFAVYQEYHPATATNTFTTTNTVTSAKSPLSVIVTGYLTFNSWVNTSGISPSLLKEWVSFTAVGGGTYTALANSAGQYWIALPANEGYFIAMGWNSSATCCTTIITSSLPELLCKGNDGGILICKSPQTTFTLTGSVGGTVVYPQTGGGCSGNQFLTLGAGSPPVVIQNLTCP